VAKRKGEKYKLMWKEDAEFVRLAMRFKCTIVPFASVGTEDAFDIAMDSEEIMASPMGPSIQVSGVHSPSWPNGLIIIFIWSPMWMGSRRPEPPGGQMRDNP
jgi:hypothetical protein